MSQFAGIHSYTSAMWQRRYFWLSLVKLDLQSRYRRSLLGVGWSLLHPIAMTVVLCVVFHSVFQVDIRQYAPFVLTGMAIWNFLSSSVIEGCQTLYAGEKYIRSYALPMAVYPLRTSLGVMFHFLLIMVVAILVTALLAGISQPLALLTLVPALVLLLLFSWSLATIFGFLNVYFPDTLHLSQVVLQMLFYLTPVFYPPEMMQQRRIGAILRYNPLGSLVELIRDPILHGHCSSASTLGVAVGTVLGTTLLAVYLLRRWERTVIFHL